MTQTNQYTEKQIVEILQNLNYSERISVLKNFKTDWIEYLSGIHQPESYTSQEYNSKLEEGFSDYNNGKITAHNKIIEEVNEWKKQKH
ncbi:MAG: hypothetical protein J7K64_03825 [Bacteroidales bacterium]|nr:hypothetical protein [Bacteroidales bacterium]